MKTIPCGALAGITGIASPQEEYFLQVNVDAKGWTFDLRGANGSAGTLRRIDHEGFHLGRLCHHLFGELMRAGYPKPAD